MFELPEGSKQREPVTAEFWKPQQRGETVVGVVARIGETHFGRNIELAPVLLWPKDGKPQGYANLKVSINSWLDKLVQDDVVSRPLAIVFSGTQATPNGQMRTFKVADIPGAKFQELLAAHAPDLVSAPAPSGGAESDDDLPF